MRRIQLLMDGMGLTFERVPAVDAHLLPPPPKSGPDEAFLLSRTEMALIGSHQKCWDLFERSEENYCVILEDDVHFGRDFAEFMRSTPVFPRDADIIKIETTPNKVWLDRPGQQLLGRHLRRLASPHLGSAGYVLRRSALEKLRRKPCDKPIDVFLFGEPKKDLTIYQMAPALVIQDNAFKDNSKKYVGLVSAIDRGRKPRIGGLKKVAREIARPFRPYWPPGSFVEKWRLSYGKVDFE